MEYLPFGFAAVLTLVLIVTAWRYGVVDQLAVSLAAACGIFAGFLSYGRFPALLKDAIGLKLPGLVNVGVALVVGFVTLIALKYILRAILRGIFNADSPLHNLSDGFFGAVLSLIPVTILLIVMAGGLRLIGTLMELRMVEHITRPGISWSKGNYPKWPITATWRDQIEAIPVVANLLEMTDPLSRKQVRNLVGLLISTQDAGMKANLESSSETGDILGSESWEKMIADQVVMKLDEKNDRPGLLRNEAIQSAASSTEIRIALRKLDIQQVIDGYMLGDEQPNRKGSDSGGGKPQDGGAPEEELPDEDPFG